jgi:phosphoglycolate phosphatase
MKPILFDIDGTLIHTGGAGRLAMIQAFEEIFGITNGFGGISMAGKTDPLIMQMAFNKHNIEASEQQINRFKRRYFELLAEYIKKDLPQKQIYAGVVELLENLHSNKQIILGLLTGNWIEGARTKLSYFQLNDYFKFGAYGSDSIDRNKLLPIALARCGECAKHNIKTEQVVVIGDTPHDIACAKVHGARALAVATGRHSVDVLKEKGADLAVQDLSDYRGIIRWIFDQGR